MRNSPISLSNLARTLLCLLILISNSQTSLASKRLDPSQFPTLQLIVGWAPSEPVAYQKWQQGIEGHDLHFLPGEGGHYLSLETRAALEDGKRYQREEVFSLGSDSGAYDRVIELLTGGYLPRLLRKPHAPPAKKIMELFARMRTYPPGRVHVSFILDPITQQPLASAGFIDLTQSSPDEEPLSATFESSITRPLPERQLEGRPAQIYQVGFAFSDPRVTGAMEDFFFHFVNHLQWEVADRQNLSLDELVLYAETSAAGARLWNQYEFATLEGTRTKTGDLIVRQSARDFITNFNRTNPQERNLRWRGKHSPSRH